MQNTREDALEFLEILAKIFLLPLLVIVFVSCPLALLSGAVDSQYKSGCTYESIASYHPLRYISCEIFKRRW